MAPRRPLVVFDFDDTLFPTTALRALCAARVARDPDFTLLGGAAPLLATWDALMAGVLGRVAGEVGPEASFAIVSAGDPRWVSDALRMYMPTFWKRARDLGLSLRAGVRADGKAGSIGDEAAARAAAGRPPDALVVVGDHDLDELAAQTARWEGSAELVARAFVRVAPCDVASGWDPIDAVVALAEDAGTIPRCIADAVRADPPAVSLRNEA